jgi:hypothetical protein
MPLQSSTIHFQTPGRADPAQPSLAAQVAEDDVAPVPLVLLRAGGIRALPEWITYMPVYHTHTHTHTHTLCLCVIFYALHAEGVSRPFS